MIKIIFFIAICLNFGFDQNDNDILDTNEFNPNYGVKNLSLYKYAQKFINQSEPVIQEIQENTKYEDSIYYSELDNEKIDEKVKSYDGFQSQTNPDEPFKYENEEEKKTFSFSSMANTFKNN